MLIRKIIVQVVDLVEPASDKDYCIKISRALFRKWQLQDQSKLILQFGNQKENVTIQEMSQMRMPVLEITPSLAKKLLIPSEILPIHCLYKQNENTLKLGPIILCVTNQMYHEEQKFGSMTTFFEELSNYAKNQHIFFYIHTLKKWDENHFTGSHLQHFNWKEDKLPLPDAVYNRIGSRTIESSNSFKSFTSFLDEQGIPYFNQHFLDKWEINESLICFPEMLPYLPDTSLFDDYESFVEKLSLYQSIFLKPMNGSQGRQILRIEKEDNEFVVHYSSFSDERSTRFPSSYILYKRIKERIKKQPFIVQEGIELVDFDRRPLDFRVLCIKNESGQWKVISSVARISAKQKKVSNLAQGGEQKRPLEVLSAIFDEKLAKQYVKLMRELSLEIAQLISESNEGIFGELGVDVAIDKHGKLWVIEVNSKPSKKDFDEAKEQIRPSSIALIHYLSYLSGFPFKRLN